MLAFPMEVRGVGTFYYVYEFTVFEHDIDIDPIQLSPASGIHVRTFGPYEPGAYYLGVQTTRVKSSPSMSFQYIPNPREIYIPFAIEEDTITVMNTKLVVHKRPRSGGGFTTSNRRRALTEDIQAQTLAEIREKDEAGLWQINPSIPESE
ncbi:hypothetical protein BGP77_05825 [Saccharospirillum sp. MSK14-1]|uniref:hypothetical protein n=1 Tax=Saccharospirillum sp. MSK14-1 TaxID=1897632 RepID=UPI000D33E7CB|nr:hypothetical protein [Saccharospirillum sp. MSK14-1]PTY36803.1 hypothetical protein BGP77_05825 [Saccharospirillum sp. MSK14-1]